MSPSDLLLLVAAGFLSGALNAVAGGGTFFTFAALLATGLPPITANATSSVALGIGSVASAALIAARFPGCGAPRSGWRWRAPQVRWSVR